jgi:hypothetical protein
MKKHPLNIHSRGNEGRLTKSTTPDRPDAARQAGGVGGARILRRWSVADLIARAGGAPRAFA